MYLYIHIHIHIVLSSLVHSYLRYWYCTFALSPGNQSVMFAGQNSGEGFLLSKDGSKVSCAGGVSFRHAQLSCLQLLVKLTWVKNGLAMRCYDQLRTCVHLSLCRMDSTSEGKGADALITKFPLNVVLELGICIVHKTCLACMRAKELGNMLLSNIS